MRKAGRVASHAALVYALAGLFWVFLSDQLLAAITPDSDLVTRFQTYKGWLFVVVTACLLYYLIRHALTRQTAAETQLRKTKDQYDHLVRLIPVGIYIWRHYADGTMGFEYVSPRFCELLGLDAAEVLRDYRLAFAAVHPDDQERLNRYNESARQTLSPFDWEGRFVVLGRIRCIHIFAHPTPQPDGGSVWMGVIEDVTENKKTERELSISATAFESQDAIMIADANRMILRVNHAFTEITGYSAEEVIGKNPNILKSDRQDADFYAAMWASINTTGSWKGEIWNRRKNGTIYPERLAISAVKNQSGEVINYVANFVDISQGKNAEKEIQFLAYHDNLTGLPNRQLMMDRLEQALASSMRTGRKGALLLIDLDNFKTLNDTLGHVMGDRLLKQVAERLSFCLRDGDTVARFGGDEFAVMLEDLHQDTLAAAEQTEHIGMKLLAPLGRPYRLSDDEFKITCSIGATVFNDHEQAIEEILKQADIAMYQAKSAGRNTLRFFDPQMQDVINARAALENDLRNALDNRQIHLHYQIQVDAANQPTGAEALIRWLHPERGFVSPVEFIPLAEESELILTIGQWVLETACTQLKLWQHDPETRDLTLSVNVSARQFLQPGFVEQLRETLDRHAIETGRLKIELTESMLLGNVEDTVSVMSALKTCGVTLSLDDFGTGYSSLSYLKRLPIGQLKIDQSFVRDIAVDDNDKAIVATIVAMAKSLGLDVIAEGVETEQQRQFLLEKGCSNYQGYLFGKPVPIEQFAALLKPH